MDSSETLDLTADLSALSTTDSSDTMSVASYRTQDTDLTFTGYDAGGLASRDRRLERANHVNTPPTKRIVTVIIKDANDLQGGGMVFTLGLTSSFKNAFDAFKAASCKQCRSVNDIRFKIDAKKIKDGDTPQSVQTNLKHDRTLSIRAFSNLPGLRCPACKKTGYPTSKGERMDGNKPILQRPAAPRPSLIRLLFLDPNGKITGIPATNTYQLRHVMSDYACRAECAMRSLYFFFDGEALALDDTPEEMGMRTNSVIEVKMHANGA